jgi:hypothetical protein
MSQLIDIVGEGSTMIATMPITIEVDRRVAQAYSAATQAQRRKLDALLSLKLSEVIYAGRSLEEVMSVMSRKAQERGLTPALLEHILEEE